MHRPALHALPRAAGRTKVEQEAAEEGQQPAEQQAVAQRARVVQVRALAPDRARKAKNALRHQPWSNVKGFRLAVKPLATCRPYAAGWLMACTLVVFLRPSRAAIEVNDMQLNKEQGWS